MTVGNLGKQEEKLQTDILHALSKMAVKEALYFHVPNGGQRNPIEGAKFKRMGVLAGVADLVFILEGSVYFMELKSAKGKQSDNQREFERRAFAAGATYVVVSNFNLALDYLAAWGVIRRMVKA